MTQYLIDFKNDALQIDIDAYLSANNCTILKVFSKLENTYHVETDLTLLKIDIIEHLIDDGATTIQLLAEVPIIQPNLGVPTTVSTTDEKDWWKVFSVEVIDFADPTPTIMVHGQGVNVYIMDSGIEITHPEFVGKDIGLVYSFTDSFADNTGHGTALSSVIVGNTCSITNASLKVVKIFDNNVATKQSDILYALDAILQDTITSTNLVSVVNMSWSIARNTYIENKIRLLVLAGLIVVCASGNSGIPIGDVTPAAMTEVLTIGSYNDSFNPSNFTNYTGGQGTTQGAVNWGDLESWAPGEQIWVAALGGGYNFTGGTSISSAIYSASMAYNASQSLAVSGDILSTFKTSAGLIDISRITRRDRSGLLNLSDPKYENSVNKICTYSVNSWSRTNIPIRYTQKAVCKVGDIRTIYFTNVLDSMSYELLTPLPNFVTIERTMLIISPIEEPTSVSNVDIYDIQIRVTPIDTSTLPYITTCRIVVTGSSFDALLLPPNDPLIEITLLVACETVLPPCTGGVCTPSDFCTDTTTGKACFCTPRG
jgi:hypothetical protein